MANEFIIPEFLKNQSIDEIHNEMLSIIPDNIGKEENGWVSDLMLPTAIQKAELVEFKLVEILKTIFPQYANHFLDEHAELRGLKRKSATYASGILTIIGKEKTVIPKGFLFSTAATLESSGVLFVLDNETTIPQSGVVDAVVTAQKAGIIGNVAAQTILLMVKPLTGLIGISNKFPTYGGFLEESDDSLRERIQSYDKEQGLSFVGSVSDYLRWAYEVPGVGNVRIISAEDDSGLVKIIVTNQSGDPASESICQQIYDHIMKPDDISARLAPINAYLKVMPPEIVEITVVASVVLSSGYGLEGVKETFVKQAKQYLKTVKDKVIYTEIGATLVNTEGVLDYHSLLVNGGTDNIPIELYALPAVNSENVVLQL